MSIRLPVLAPADKPREPSVKADERVFRDHASPVFGDDVWDFTKGLQRRNALTITVNWATARERCGDAWTLTIKELAWHRLNTSRKKPRLRPVKASTVHSEAGILIALAEYLANQGITQPSAMRQEMETRLLAWFTQGKGARQARSHVMSFKRLYEYRDFLSESLPHEPWVTSTVGMLVPLPRNGENETPQIPPQVMRPLLDGCFHILEKQTDARLAAYQALLASREDQGDTSLKRAGRWLARRAELGRGAPVGRQRGTLNAWKAGREAGMWTQTFKNEEIQELVQAHVAEYGWDEDRSFELEPPPKLDKRSALQRLKDWGRGRLEMLPKAIHPATSDRCPYPSDDVVRTVNVALVSREAGFSDSAFYRHRGTCEALWHELKRIVELCGVEDSDFGTWRAEASLHPLLTAAYVVIAYLTGMRDSEVAEIVPGAIEARRSDDGVIERLWIRSREFKGVKSAKGQERRWVAIQPVADAVKVLERRAEAVGFDAEKQGLCGGIKRSNYGSPFLPAHHFTQLRDYINVLAAADDGRTLKPIPDVNGKPWHFTSRQFRRTLAWFIARQPLGTIAGSIQYGHVKAATFDAYAGTTYENFHEEVAEEELNWSDDEWVREYQAWEGGGGPRGPKRKEVETAFKAVQAQAALEFPGRVMTDQELKRLLKNQGLGLLRQGIFNLCAFDPSRAGCLERDLPDYEKTAPIQAFCDPFGCENSCIASWQRPAVEENLRETESWLKTRGISGLQKQYLRNYADKIRRALDDDEAA